MNYRKYRAFKPVDLPDRQWPDKSITKAPGWCSVDLRDGNQALPVPMSVEEKIEMFELLLSLGFKEIEVGFPSASETEFEFLRRLIDENRIPEDVTVQILTQARAHLIERSFEAIKGAKKAIIHFYNSTSTVQRDVVFNKSREEIIEIAVEGARLIKEIAAKHSDTEIRYEYSPESFTGTELDFAKEICDAVIEIIDPDEENKLIINLPATVEMSLPNIYADQIEWMCRNINRREHLIISLHTHNDRGTGAAASELGLLAGADRVEGTLFGNGERTGNVDIITLAMNLYSQGIDPELDFSDINRLIEVYERCTKMTVPPRHPYAGELVYTAFSGSHQDAIRKGLEKYRKSDSRIWDLPYLPIEPADLQREYEAIIRINSQSGKGGVAFVLEDQYGLKLPKAMHPEFSAIIQRITDERGDELKGDEIYDVFNKEYLTDGRRLKLHKYKINAILDDDEATDVHNAVEIIATMEEKGERFEMTGHGNGPIDAFFHALIESGHLEEGVRLSSYSEHALTEGADSQAVAYIQMVNKNGQGRFGVGVDPSINGASLKALLCALDRMDKMD
ncbi:2-isopropylmalate synthase [Spirochaeta isovalerica]|uniref:2-isopropylmalate synthase n=1 Tax=Spirochaeta isovalerica TaxID=150 RepID=A0A841RAB9_9SPIO|nr:2-isopropylmalate synthase [Spirochaeta isovalerica]MBB6480853.1 2-isopropylmalate synthase [Spirochaeta isovalerica]